MRILMQKDHSSLAPFWINWFETHHYSLVTAHRMRISDIFGDLFGVLSRIIQGVHTQ